MKTIVALRDPPVGDEAAEAEVPRVLVVDPRFDAYGNLAAAARRGDVQLHFRSSTLAARALMKRRRFDLCIVGEDLDDMDGEDFLELLRSDVGNSYREVVADSEALATAGIASLTPLAGGKTRFAVPGTATRVCQSLIVSGAAAAATISLLMAR